MWQLFAEQVCLFRHRRIFTWHEKMVIMPEGHRYAADHARAQNLQARDKMGLCNVWEEVEM